MLTWGTIYYLLEWVIRIVMLLYVPQKRSPAAARSWLLFIFVVPVVGVIAYALIGRVYMPRRRIHMQDLASRSIRTALAATPPQVSTADVRLTEKFAEAIALTEKLGAFPMMGGNRVELLTEYSQSIDKLVADIDGAQHHAHILYYIFEDDATGNRVADALGRAASRGVKCRVLMDSAGSKRSLRTLAPRMRDAGIEVIGMLPVGFFQRSLARFDLRNHRKIAVVDGEIGHVGSQNLVNADFKKGLQFEELVARVRGPMVTALQALFISDWFFETEELIRDEPYFRRLDPAGNTTMQCLPSGPGFEEENTQRVLVSLMHEAQSRIVITTPYFVPDEAFMHALKSACIRGVEVHLVVSRQIDQLIVGLAQRSFYEDLLDVNARIHLYKPRFMHAKHVSIDDSIALIGSSNMDIRSFALNAEASVLVYDPDVVGELKKVQEGYFANSDLIDPARWVRRSLPEQLLENTARLVSSVL